MDTLHLTSPPRASARNPGYVWVYYSDVTADGRACGALVPAYCASRLYKDMEFRRDQLSYNEQLRSEVLALDEQSPLPEEPSLPPHPERGWGDADNITATCTTPTMARPSGLTGTRGPAHRKEAARIDGSGIPADLLQLLETASRSYSYVRTRIGATDPARSDHARALAITALIAYTREQGATISPGDEPQTIDALEKILASQA
jgi:hypothetical protein